ncbi:aminotransferase class I/II-fold pyridoxal phosphate-dependent enzyme [Streptomyces atroolivaceus]
MGGGEGGWCPGAAFRHNDVAHLLRRIEEYGPGVIAVDSLYSVCGSIAPLGALCEVAEQTGCVLVVDEANSLGTHGPQRPDWRDGASPHGEYVEGVRDPGRLHHLYGYG